MAKLTKLEQLLGVKLTKPVKSTEQNPPVAGVWLSSVREGAMFFRRWDGENWHYGDTDKEAAARIHRPWPKGAPLWWQGLAEDPNKGAENVVQS